MVRLVTRVRHGGRRSVAGVLVLATLALTTIVLTSSPWRAAAQRAADDNAVRVDSSTRQRFERSLDRGATYYWLDAQAIRTVTRFSDALGVTERDAGGDLRTRLTDLAGNELATFTVDRMSALEGVLEYREPGGQPLRASARADQHSTGDWSNQQAYSLWKDQHATRGGPLEWQGRLMRPRGAPPRDIDAAIVDLRIEWPDGFTSTSARRSGRRQHALSGAPLRGTTFLSRLQHDGLDVGYSQWYVEEQVYEWSFPGITDGYVDGERLAEIGGWPFTPDLAWVNVQNFAFHRLGTVAKEQTARQQPGWLQKAVGFFAPTLSANDVGCDYLHWLDGSVFRACCDTHDRCYEKYGCTARSWWMYWTSWRCDFCNVYAVFCFMTGGKLPFRQTPW